MEYNPWLSIATATLEIGAGIWTLRGAGRKTILHATAAILFLLAGYQIIEAVLCTGLLTVSESLLGRLAFVVVAWLPPTGLLLLARLSPWQKSFLRGYAYAMYLVCAALVLGIVLDPNFVTASVCLVVFARYTNPTPLYQAYGLFYQSSLFGLLIFSALATIAAEDRSSRRLLGQLLLGSISFIFPSMVVVSAFPIAEDALPSIMCHFALFLAFFLIKLVAVERESIQKETSDTLPEALSWRITV
ncbi:MAG: hypothetical protein NZL98_08555 [Anaerolineales bacterium]|nr:hypothetical protein [Anaerolineales bacterium]MDW8228023.1 hypothetical protein [Anaerolineales bacterium]